MNNVVEPKYRFFRWQMTTANVITLLRVPLLILVVILICYPGLFKSLAAFVLLVSLFLMDWLDGYVARRRNEETTLGSILDIAVDRTVENALWWTFIVVGLVPLFIGLIFLIRSFIIDGLRSYAQSQGKTAFGMMTSSLGKFLVASRFMRAFYGLTKAFAFGALIVLQMLGSFGPAIPSFYPDATQIVVWISVYLSAILCITRGVPVLMEAPVLLQK